eukprot:TRINITY_DN58280_c0_g1_i1.p1 TRINITY_DN58280_c0_g1~~TRINITY_DN58280_c0_g1_i1.p1  ORF type:complete len:807 (-),score=185.44 TRINITY_DN58280_c0_g1_i1:80-2500(-)
MAEATDELLDAVDRGDLTEDEVRRLVADGADPRQALGKALQAGNVVSILALAAECASTDPKPPRRLSQDELLSLAASGDWAHVAYYVAADEDVLPDRLRARDVAARKALKRAMGVVEARLPKDLAASSTERGRGCGGGGEKGCALGPNGLAPELLVEQQRWLLPRPRPENCFTYARDGKKLDEGWYTVAQHPVSDDPREAVLWRQNRTEQQRAEAARLLREPRFAETLLCKAVKDGQWDLAEWLLRQCPVDKVDLAEQLEREFVDIWSDAERRATLTSRQDLKELCSALDEDGVLTRSWRFGVEKVPAGSRVRWPALSILKEAVALDKLGLEGLRRYCGAVVTFNAQPLRGVCERWQADLVDVGERSFGRPLLHWVVLSGRTQLLKSLLDAEVSLESCDSDNLNALAFAANVGQLDAVDLILDPKYGCRSEGRNGSVVVAALRRVINRNRDAEEVAQATMLLEKLSAQREQAPTASLADFFLRQARGELVGGREPRRYENKDGALELRRGGCRVWDRVLILDDRDSGHEVLFVELSVAAYAGVTDGGALDLVGKRLVPEALLSAADAVAVAVPSGRLLVDREGVAKVKPGSAGPVAASLPQIARAQPTGEVRMTSCAACCCIGVGRVELRVDGVRLGETKSLVDLPDTFEMVISMPRREFKASIELSGRRISEQTISVSSDPVCIEIEVPLAIIVYVQVVDPEEGLEFIFVCCHKQDLPDDPPARTFLGEVRWEGGSKQVSTFEPIVLGGSSCLDQLKSLQLAPKLASGRAYEAVDWEDTGECQFKRCLANPVRIGLNVVLLIPLN